jgi:hypothetical protein
MQYKIYKRIINLSCKRLSNWGANAVVINKLKAKLNKLKRIIFNYSYIYKDMPALFLELA